MESSPVSQDLFSRVVLDDDWIQHHFGRKKERKVENKKKRERKYEKEKEGRKEK